MSVENPFVKKDQQTGKEEIVFGEIEESRQEKPASNVDSISEQATLDPASEIRAARDAKRLDEVRERLGMNAVDRGIENPVAHPLVQKSVEEFTKRIVDELLSIQKSLFPDKFNTEDSVNKIKSVLDTYAASVVKDVEGMKNIKPVDTSVPGWELVAKRNIKAITKKLDLPTDWKFLANRLATEVGGDAESWMNPKDSYNLLFRASGIILENTVIATYAGKFNIDVDQLFKATSQPSVEPAVRP